LDPFQESIPSPELAWHPRPKFRDRVWLHVLLLLLTVLTTTTVGVGHYLGYRADLPAGAPMLSPRLIAGGLWYSVTIILILGSHELGHYLACRYYDVDASLPFFLPFPSIFGTLGAVIRIREPIPKKAMLFDIGIAGPLAGFAVAVPAMFIGMAMSRVTPVHPDSMGLPLGDPLLIKLAAKVFWGTLPTGYDIDLHPMAFAAWFGMLATVWNLFPAGQLDGGHISYSLLGRKAWMVTLATLAATLVLIYFCVVWIGLAVMITGMTIVFGPHHPPVIDEDVPLDNVRIGLAAVALVIFVVSFTPAPFPNFALIGR